MMPNVGDTVDRFVIEAHVGSGGMASVYRVRHTSLGSLHALKVLDLPYASIRARLVQEGRVQAQLSHPNIVAVTDLVEVEGAPGLIMAFVDGPNLEAWLAGNRPDPTTIDALFQQILAAVACAHDNGLVHRDLKPGNVLLQKVDGAWVPKIADFGLARLLTLDEAEGGPVKRTRSGIAMGTPGYMAPEQIRNAKDADQRADVFSLGCILYELWCGVPAFRSDSVYDVLVAIEGKDYVTPLTIRPDLPARVAAVIAGCLEPDRDQRIQSIAAFKQALYPTTTSIPSSNGNSSATGAVWTPPDAAQSAALTVAIPDPRGLPSALEFRSGPLGQEFRSGPLGQEFRSGPMGQAGPLSHTPAPLVVRPPKPRKPQGVSSISGWLVVTLVVLLALTGAVALALLGGITFVLAIVDGILQGLGDL